MSSINYMLHIWSQAEALLKHFQEDEALKDKIPEPLRGLMNDLLSRAETQQAWLKIDGVELKEEEWKEQNEAQWRQFYAAAEAVVALAQDSIPEADVKSRFVSLGKELKTLDENMTAAPYGITETRKESSG